MYAPIDFPPGVARNGTRYQTRGRWYDANLVRWIDGQIAPVGGWSKLTTTALDTKPRALFPWLTNGGGKWLAIGTSAKLWATQITGSVSDITPVGFTVGNDDPTFASGYGAGTYGSGFYGVPRTGSTPVPPQSWYLDSWGENLVACARSDGNIYEWALTGVATVLSNAPTSCSGILVSDQRHVIAFGAGGIARKAQWSAKEDNNDWTVSTTNEAGSFEFQTVGEFMRAVRVRSEHLVLYSTDAHVMRYIGQPFIFNRERVGLDCGLIGPNAVATADALAVWMGQKAFFAYEGGAVVPVPCEVSSYVFNDINRTMSHKITAGNNGAFGEMWWFYPSANATENDRYVIFNYRAKHWSIGQIGRTAWCDAGVFSAPLATATDNHLYQHEEGWLADGVTRVGDVWAESGVFEVGQGDNIMHVNGVLPDEGDAQVGDLTVSFRTRFTPQGDEYSFGPYTMRADGYTDTRFSGRQFLMRVEQTQDEDWRLGRFRADVVGGGKR